MEIHTTGVLGYRICSKLRHVPAACMGVQQGLLQPTPVQDGQVVDVLQAQANLSKPLYHCSLGQRSGAAPFQRSLQVSCRGHVRLHRPSI